MTTMLRDATDLTVVAVNVEVPIFGHHTDSFFCALYWGDSLATGSTLWGIDPETDKSQSVRYESINKASSHLAAALNNTIDI